MDEQGYRDESLCRECREQEIRYPFPKKMIPVGLAVQTVLDEYPDSVPVAERMTQLTMVLPNPVVMLL